MDTTDLDPVLARAASGAPLTPAERAALHASTDLLGLGMAADQVRRLRHGGRMTFLRVAVVPFGVDDLHESQWAGAGEIRLAGTPADWSDAAGFVRRVSALVPKGVPLSGFSLAAMEEACGGRAGELTALARELRGAGLDLVAEAPLDRLRHPEASIGAVTEGGLSVLRLTVDLAAPEAQPVLLAAAAALAAAVPSLQAFAPLPRRTGDAPPSTGFEDVRLVALARLIVGISHVQVDWPLYGPKLAQVGLTFGADDVDGVSPLGETGEGRRRAPLEEIRRNIRAASGEPQERDGRFLARG